MSGLRHINQLIQNLSSESVLQGPNNNSPAPAPVLTSEEQLEADKKAVLGAWEAYINNPVISDEGEHGDESRLDDFDIMCLWQVHAASVFITFRFQ